VIPEILLNQIQDRLDIVEIISAYVPLKKSGRNFKAPCPFHHEKTPSFMVSPDKQIFHCFGCGVGGNVFSFLMKQEKKDFLEVVEMLAERVGIEIPKDRYANPQDTERNALFFKAHASAADYYYEVLMSGGEGEKARGYLKKRGVSEEATRAFKLGYAPDSWDGLYRSLKNKIPDAVLEKAGLVIPRKEGGFYDRFRQRLVFPILDSKGVCIAFGGRVLDDSLPKYLNSPESEIYSKGKQLYGFFQARKAIHEHDSVIVVEGYLDLIACHQAGVENVVASLGTALTPEQVRLIKRHTKNVFILYDADAAGELATLRGLELFLEEGLEVKIVRLAAGHDPDSYVKEFGVARFREELAKAKTLFEYKLILLKERHDSRSVEGKVKIANDMVTLFSKVQNEILRSAWLRELAKELVLSEEALVAEMRKAEGRIRNPKVTEATPVGLPNEVRSVEKLLIGLMLDDTHFILDAKAQIRAEDFQNPTARNIVKRLLQSEASAPLPPVQLINFYKDDPESVRIISLSCAETETVVDKEKTFADCLSWVKRSRVKHELEGLRSQLETAQGKGDKSRLHQILYDLDGLNKGIRKINEKK